MRSWDLTMRAELDYREEANNLREVQSYRVNYN
jgi:predicted unusual protein kinase regulating ubiquinone biosynthesis (AarF/ABC1/UbiB family)